MFDSISLRLSLTACSKSMLTHNVWRLSHLLDGHHSSLRIIGLLYCNATRSWTCYVTGTSSHVSSESAARHRVAGRSGAKTYFRGPVLRSSELRVRDWNPYVCRANST